MRKHLIFHFCVNEETGWAYEHIKTLQKHIDLFDGYRFFSICEPNNDLRNNKLVPEILKMKNEKTTINYIINDATSREVKPFFDMHLPALQLMSDHSTDYCFYGHTKGSSRPYTDALNAWNTTLWKYNIEKYDELIEPNFGKYKTIGCLRKTKEKAGEFVGDGILESYHFSGTFFWFSCDIFNRPWFDPNRTSPHVIERWPGVITGLDDSKSVFDVEDSKLYYHDEFWQAHNIKGDM